MFKVPNGEIELGVCANALSAPNTKVAFPNLEKKADA